MAQSQLLAAIRKATYCFAWVNYNQDDGCYVQVTKQALKHAFGGSGAAHIKFDATFRDNNCLYIN